MRKRACASLSRGQRCFHPRLEQLTSRLVPAALVDFAAGPLAAFDPSEADVMIVADEPTEAEADAVAIEAIFTEEGKGDAGPVLPTDSDFTDETTWAYLTCMPVGEDFTAGDDELLYTCGFAEEPLPADEYELIFTTTVVDGEGGKEIPAEGEWLPVDSEILVDPMPEGEPVDDVVYWGDLENPEILSMMGGPMMPPAAEAAPTTTASPGTGNQCDIVSALSPATPRVSLTQANANAAPRFSVLPATQVASAISIGKPASSSSGTGGGADSEQDSSCAVPTEGGTQAALPESASREEVSAAPAKQSGDERSSAPVHAAEEAALPTAASAAVPDAAAAVMDDSADVVLATPLAAESVAETGSQLPGAAWGLTAAATVLTMTDRQRRPVELTSR